MAGKECVGKKSSCWLVLELPLIVCRVNRSGRLPCRRCSVCKEDRQADKKLEIWKLPEILIIHLKRFSYNSYFRDKLSTEVDFPLEGLDLSDYVLSEEDRQNCVYDLYAVSNHMGVMGGGHCTSCFVCFSGASLSFEIFERASSSTYFCTDRHCLLLG